MLKANARQRAFRHKQRLIRLAQAQRDKTQAQTDGAAALTRSLGANRYLWALP